MTQTPNAKLHSHLDKNTSEENRKRRRRRSQAKKIYAKFILLGAGTFGKIIHKALAIHVSPQSLHFSCREVLQFTRERHALTVWKWPLDSLGIPMATNNLLENCASLDIAHPGCLCPLEDIDCPPFVEASISLNTRAGSHYGEYVAECSAGLCGYFVPLQRIRCLKIAEMYEKGKEKITSHGTGLIEATPARKELKRSYAALELVTAETPYTIALQTPSAYRQATDTEILLKLNDYAQPGLYDVEFRALLGRMVRCSCRMVMLRRVYKEHRCRLSLLRPLKRQRLDTEEESQLGDNDMDSNTEEEDNEDEEEH